VEVRDRGEGPRGEEGVAEVLDHALHATLLVAAGHRTRLGREVVMAGELEEPRMEADVLAAALEDDALQVVVQEHPRDPAQGGEGLDMPPQEALQRLIEGE